MAAEIIAFPGRRVRHPSNVPGTVAWAEMAMKVAEHLRKAGEFADRMRRDPTQDYSNVTREQLVTLYLEARSERP